MRSVNVRYLDEVDIKQFSIFECVFLNEMEKVFDYLVMRLLVNPTFLYRHRSIHLTPSAL